MTPVFQHVATLTKAMARGLFLFAIVVAAAPAVASNCAPTAKLMARTELLFGAGRVSDVQWKRFLAREVTPRFPDGLTVLEGYGQWMAPHGTLARERSRVLLIWHERSDSTDRKLDAIRASYKRQFHQTSVMRVDGMDCVSF
jgi:hypothetical protein